MEICKYYKEMHEDGQSVMCVSKVYQSGERIVVYPNDSINKHTYGEVRETATQCTQQEFEIIRLRTVHFLK